MWMTPNYKYNSICSKSQFSFQPEDHQPNVIITINLIVLWLIRFSITDGELEVTPFLHLTLALISC